MTQLAEREPVGDENSDAWYFQANGSIRPVTPENGRVFSLKELQDFVHGYIEILTIDEGRRLAVVNEEGQQEGLPFNNAASSIVNMPGVMLVGDVLICPANMIE